MSYTFYDLNKKQESPLNLKNCTITGNSVAYVAKDGIITKYKLVEGKIDANSAEVVPRIELTGYQMSFIDLIKGKDNDDSRLDENDLKNITSESLQQEINELYRRNGIYEAVFSEADENKAEIKIKDNTEIGKRIAIEFEKDSLNETSNKTSNFLINGLVGGIVGGTIGGFIGKILKSGLKKPLLLGAAIGVLGGTLTGIYNSFKSKSKQEPTSIDAIQTTQPEPEEQYDTYKVKSGDNLEKIAHNHGLYRWELVNANEGITDSTILQIGQELKIPKPKPLKTYNELSEPTKKFLKALANRESSNNSTAENQVGYLGLYQMGEKALISIGAYKEDSTKDKNDWKGSWVKDNKLGITSKEDFLRSPEKQHNAVIRYAQLNWIDIRRMGLDKYVGKDIAGIRITESGLIAGAHLVGVGGLKEFILSNGKKDKTDGNGVHVSTYVSEFAGHDISDFKTL